VICEIMNDDGTMARLPDLIAFAQRHGLKIGTIADLIAYRRRTERWSSAPGASSIQLDLSAATGALVYANTVDGAEHLALVKGDVADGGRCWCACMRSTARRHAGRSARRRAGQHRAARLRHRRADPARSWRQGDGAAVEHQRTIVGLEGYGLTVVGQRRTPFGLLRREAAP
jgi:hypothetical protein